MRIRLFSTNVTPRSLARPTIVIVRAQRLPLHQPHPRWEFLMLRQPHRFEGVKGKGLHDNKIESLSSHKWLNMYCPASSQSGRLSDLHSGQKHRPPRSSKLEYQNAPRALSAHFSPHHSWRGDGLAQGRGLPRVSNLIHGISSQAPLQAAVAAACRWLRWQLKILLPGQQVRTRAAKIA